MRIAGETVPAAVCPVTVGTARRRRAAILPTVVESLATVTAHALERELTGHAAMQRIDVCREAMAAAICPVSIRTCRRRHRHETAIAPAVPDSLATGTAALGHRKFSGRARVQRVRRSAKAVPAAVAAIAARTCSHRRRGRTTVATSIAHALTAIAAHAGHREFPARTRVQRVPISRKTMPAAVRSIAVRAGSHRRRGRTTVAASIAHALTAIGTRHHDVEFAERAVVQRVVVPGEAVPAAVFPVAVGTGGHGCGWRTTIASATTHLLAAVCAGAHDTEHASNASTLRSRGN